MGQYILGILVKVVNLLVSTKKGSASKSAKLKFAKKGGNASKYAIPTLSSDREAQSLDDGILFTQPVQSQSMAQ